MNLPDDTLLNKGKYKIVRFISSGGFGCTYEAVDTRNGRRVAIKELFVKDVSDRDATLTISAFTTNKSALLERVKRKFLEEANALKSMSHPNIVKVFDIFEDNGTAYYVMDYIDGASLYDIVKAEGALPESRAIRYIEQVAKALQYVHEQNRLHLDIKPGNIMIDKNDNAILIDFGVSKQYDEVNGESTSTVLGKAPGYSPIEQLGNNIQHFTPATDIYALGATLYKCVTGKTPPDATVILSEGYPKLPSGLKAATKLAIRKSMLLKVSERPQNISQFLSYLDSGSTKPVKDLYGDTDPDLHPGRKKNRFLWVWIMCGLLAVGAIAASIVYISQNKASSSKSHSYDYDDYEDDFRSDDYNESSGSALSRLFSGFDKNEAEPIAEEDYPIVEEVADSVLYGYTGRCLYSGNMIYKGKKYPFSMILDYDDGVVVSGNYRNDGSSGTKFNVDAYYESGYLYLYNESQRNFIIELSGDMYYMSGRGHQDGYPEQDITLEFEREL